MAARKSAAAATRASSARSSGAKTRATKTTAAKKAGATPATKTTKAATKSAAKKTTKAATTQAKTSAVRPRGRPRTVTDEELYAVLLEEPSPSRAAQLLGIHRNTIVARLKDPELRDRLIEHRRRAAEVASVYLADRVGDAARTLVELVDSSGPQDSVRLGAALSLLRLVRDMNKHDTASEKPDEVWAAPPRFELRLVRGGAEDVE